MFAYVAFGAVLARNPLASFTMNYAI